MSQPNNIEALREVLFQTIAGVRDGSLSLDKAKAVGNLAQVIVNSAKVEVDFIEATNSAGSGFMAPSKQLPAGITGVHVHKVR